jgi:hypothetical protein
VVTTPWSQASSCNGSSRFRTSINGIVLCALFALVSAACSAQPPSEPGVDDDVERKQSAVVTFPWQRVGPWGYYDEDSFPVDVRYNGTVAEIRAFPADTGSNPPGIIRMATTAGGIYEYCPGPNCSQAQWVSLMPTLVPTSPRVPGEGLAATTFASDPANGYNTIVFGTANAVVQGTQLGSGIWRGTRSGSTWTWTNTINETSVSNVRRILWGGGGYPTRVHAATDNGYWRSDDGGVTWTQFNTGCTGTFKLTDIADYRGQYLLAVGICSSDTQFNLWRRSPGQNWTKIHTLTPNAAYAWLAVGSTNAYILSGRFFPDADGVVERYNGTTFFSSTTPVTQILGQVSQGYNGAIAVDPTSDSTVYVGAQLIAKNTTSGTGTWTALTYGHPDFHHFLFTRSLGIRSLWASSDAGVHVSQDYTSASPTWNDSYNYFAGSHVTAIDVANRTGGQIEVFAGTWDSRLAYGIDDDTNGASDNWTFSSNTAWDEGTVVADPAAPGVVWATDGLLHDGFMTTDNFHTQNVALGKGGHLVHDQVSPVFLYQYSGSGTEIYRSTSPQTVPVAWTKFADGPPDSCPCYNAFGVGKWNGFGSNLYVAPANLGGIWRASAGSTTFTQTSAPTGGPYTKIHGWVSSDPTAEATAYALMLSSPPTILRTRDGGATWKNIRGNLPATIAPGDIAADPVNPDIVFVSVYSGESGIWMTTNASAATPSWSRWVAGLPAGGSYASAYVPNSGYGAGQGTQLRTLDLGPAGRWLYAGFWGGSVWKRRTDGTD